MTTCKCGEGCEEYSCFVGTNCECCIETYGDKRAVCDCHDCRVIRYDKKLADEVAAVIRGDDT